MYSIKQYYRYRVNPTRFVFHLVRRVDVYGELLIYLSLSLSIYIYRSIDT